MKIVTMDSRIIDTGKDFYTVEKKVGTNNKDYYITISNSLGKYYLFSTMDVDCMEYVYDKIRRSILKEHKIIDVEEIYTKYIRETANSID